MRIITDIFLSKRFFWILAVNISLFVISFPFQWVFIIAKLALVFTVILLILDIVLVLNSKINVKASRKLSEKLSLGDINNVKLNVEIQSPYELKINVIDELPYQLQKRDLNINAKVDKELIETFHYEIKPNERGKYLFGNILIYANTLLGIVQRRFTIEQSNEIHVYPSILQMKEFELIAFSGISHMNGIKKIRKLGHNYEFEHIKNYVKGDDYRSINWKATSRKGDLMVNQYQDERSQQIYSVIDKSRVMRLPFNDLTLLDHAINSSLVVSNICLRKQDKAGVITFSDKLGSVLKADRNCKQIKLILETLYNQKTDFQEANYEHLYYTIKKSIKVRSLLFLYTNFESIYAMERVLPLLRKLNKTHLLVVIFFKDTELIEFSRKKSKNLEEIYLTTIAEDFLFEKRRIVSELQKYGIQTILTSPEELSMNSVNKYLELKSRDMI